MENKKYEYVVYGVINGKSHEWGVKPTRADAWTLVGALCEEYDLQVVDIFYRDEPHHHEETLAFENGRDHVFIDRIEA
jgi:hypothetical protein